MLSTGRMKRFGKRLPKNRKRRRGKELQGNSKNRQGCEGGRTYGEKRDNLVLKKILESQRFK